MAEPVDPPGRAAGLARGGPGRPRRRRRRARRGRPHERPADLAPGGRLPHAARDRRPDRRDGLAPVADLTGAGPSPADSDRAMTLDSDALDRPSPRRSRRRSMRAAPGLDALTTETLGRRHRRRRHRRLRARCSTRPRAGCARPSSSRTTSRSGPRRARRGSSTAACATSSSSGSASSARRWPNGRGSCTSRRTSFASSRCCSRSTASRSRRRRSTTPG